MFIMFTIDSEYLAAMQPHAIVRVFRELFKFLLSVLQLCEYSELFESIIERILAVNENVRACDA